MPIHLIVFILVMLSLSLWISPPVGLQSCGYQTGAKPGADVFYLGQKVEARWQGLSPLSPVNA
jgi:hypothetical protein